MSTKVMTHAGTVLATEWRGAVTSTEVQLRETPKFWITRLGDRYHKSKEHDGSIELQKGDTWHRHTSWLQTKSIRPLSTEEQRQPLVTAVEKHTRAYDEAVKKLDAAVLAKTAATKALDEAVAALAAFEAQHS